MNKVRDYISMTKPGISLTVLVTTAIGFLTASGVVGETFWVLLVGTALAGAGANVLNMAMEAKLDALMKRTEDRPIAAGRISVWDGYLFGALCAVAGVAIHAALINGLTAALTAFTIGSYVFLYTPLKTRTSVCTLVGALPGALPPVIGWAAATGAIGAGAWMFFLILFFWQLPHFLAIAWMYREDYAAAKMPMLPVQDPDGRLTGRQIVLHTTALVAASIAPLLVGMGGPIYLLSALLLGLGMLFIGVRFALLPCRLRARNLFLASIMYLPVLFSLLAYGG